MWPSNSDENALRNGLAVGITGWIKEWLSKSKLVTEMEEGKMSVRVGVE